MDVENPIPEFDYIAFYGRSLAEYEKIYQIDRSELKGLTILDCASGPATFSAELRAIGGNVTAVDPQYKNNNETLREKGERDIDHIIERMIAAPGSYTFNHFSNWEEIRQTRRRTLHQFCDDFALHQPQGHYLHGALPELPFADNHFDIVLCSHLLFTYSKQLSFEFHRASIWELLRVSRKELRLFPINDLQGKRHPDFEELLKELAQANVETEISRSPFDSIQGMNELLVLRKM